ncbi:MAG TPA: hypothetical protein VFR82_05820 [Nitrospira sp.]|nr:hypothetical protein [Nitrospira sp.]
MKVCLTMKRLVLLSSVTFMLGATVSSVDAEDRLVEGAMILAPAEGRSSMGNISEDTLEACLARISERVTPEQRMLAQQVCHADEATRQLEPLGVKGD